MFGLSDEETKDDENKCPGENKCGEFKIAFSETGNGLDACSGCDLLPTKPRVIRPAKPVFGGCPGESACSDFQSAAGANRDEKESNACIGCPKFPTKPTGADDDGESEQTEIDKFINRLKWLHSQHKFGGLDFYSISAIEWYCLIYFESCYEQAERENKVYTRFALENLLPPELRALM